MKKILIIALLFISGISFTGCFDVGEPEPIYWYDFATMYQDDSNLGYYFIIDNGDELMPTNRLSISDFEDSARVIVTYSVTYENVTDGKTIYTGEIVTIDGILTKDIIQLTEANEDSIGNDEVFIPENPIWLSEKHLNIIFQYFGYNGSHYINLAKPIGEQTDDEGNQILEFRHNNNDDLAKYVWEAVVSFSMDSLYQPGMDSINFVLQAVNGDTINYEHFGTYHFSQELKSAYKDISPKTDYSKLIE